MKAKDIMSTDIVYVSSNTSIHEASKLMKEHNIGFLPIIDNDYIYGVLTDRDIVIRVLSNNTIFCTVKECATTSPLYMVKEDTDIRDVINLMSDKQIRRVLVLNNNGDFTGIISLKDIILSSNIEDKLKGIFIDCNNPIVYVNTDLKI